MRLVPRFSIPVQQVLPVKVFPFAGSQQILREEVKCQVLTRFQVLFN